MFRILLVDDNSSFRRVVKTNLQDQFPAMDIVEAADGGEALRQIDSSPPHLIFMDIGLPGEDGLALTRKIKASHPNVIISILTGYDLQKIQETAIRSGADYLLSKGSIATGEIVTLLKSILSEKGFNADGSAEPFRSTRRGKITPLILKRRIWWEPVPDVSSYVVYVSKGRTIFEPDQFSWEQTPGIISKLVVGKTELVLPEEWPEFPAEPGMYYIGITSRDDLGNQSDPFLLSGLFKFHAPPTPSRGGIDHL